MENIKKCSKCGNKCNGTKVILQGQLDFVVDCCMGITREYNICDECLAKIKGFLINDESLKEYDNGKWIDVDDHLPGNNMVVEVCVKDSPDSIKAIYSMHPYFMEHVWWKIDTACDCLSYMPNNVVQWRPLSKNEKEKEKTK